MARSARALAAVFGLLVVSAPLRGGERLGVDEQPTLNSAVVAGRTSEVQPYMLLESVGSRNVVGAVYSQFVRVARYVWLNREPGLDLDVVDLPDSVKRNELQVVMTLPPATETADGLVMAAVNRPPSAVPAGFGAYFVQSERRLIPPIANIGLETFERTVGKVPIRRAGLVGMFRPELSERKVLEFCAYRHGDDHDSVYVVCGYVAGPIR
jgi:hypothetical protein